MSKTTSRSKVAQAPTTSHNDQDVPSHSDQEVGAPSRDELIAKVEKSLEVASHTKKANLLVKLELLKNGDR